MTIKKRPELAINNFIEIFILIQHYPIPRLFLEINITELLRAVKKRLLGADRVGGMLDVSSGTRA